ncbi:DUF262 domain-containing protein [Helicobacter sp. MIT 14-3879]|uniref:DUF262 domain-containing protein n=1 Tax=Helicobacter sp. MIT 14-3879 TaxID=2040649 RepID=UPI000E1E9170|nr:DUF262 domain-containing protein [Helicobacter sp. MIT 14-3879]RDU64084.1 DUF262 domain-containing protein [Helicobacter sp. MIT 14-3879]
MEFKPTKEYIAKLLGNEGIRFIIPEYQRPYRWEKDQCETLWNDIIEVFESENEEYFLGSIVTYRDNNDELSIIDGQQRITTFILIFRAFYECFESENDKGDFPKDFGKCIWDYERDKGLLYEKTHLKSQVAIESDLDNLEKILSKTINNEKLNNNSFYVKNYFFFYEKLKEFKTNHSMSWGKFCNFILGNKLFVLLVICDSQESAMIIFNTLNSRGLPLLNSDILKGHIYRYKKNNQGDSHQFTQDWQYLETLIEYNKEIEGVDFFFLQYMHIIRAVKGDYDTTKLSMLSFFTKKDRKKKYYGALDDWLYKDGTIPFIINLAKFWTSYKDFLSDISCRYMNVLNLFQNASWKSFVSCLVYKNREYFENDDFDKVNFSKDFDKYLVELIKYMTLLFLNNNATTSISNEIVFKLNVNVLQKKDLSTNFTQKYEFPKFEDFKEFCISYPRKMKYLLYLYAFIYSDFKDDIIEASKLQIEHILPQKWQYKCNDWTEKLHKKYLEEIGNKILLDSKTNSKCSDNFFAYKQRIYSKKGDNSLKEIKDLGSREKHIWLKEDIEARNKEIYRRLKAFFDKNS